MAKESFLVIGAGAWGTALSIRLAKNELEVSLTSRDKENLSEIRKTKEKKNTSPASTFLNP
jgi:glycerol-3-phosphate dehydrogenase